ncbi:MAG TPA: glycosyltransferase family 1 protein [Thermoanaerobaculia bacterium]|nr:glycosyltransferase family 1 protein [Thermoanaerobaculia bacterium]
MTSVVQIVPSLPPPLEGVGSYALSLAAALRSHCGIESSFVAAATLPAKTPEALRAALEPGATALLHYVGYGYHPRGCPDWLVDGLEGWKGRLVTVFHEVWATGPPWTSSFWLSPRQRRLAGRLARRSDGLLTSMTLYRRRLLRHSPGREVVVMPVFSTVGEPAQLPLIELRAPRLVLFGGPGTRSRAYRHLRADLEHTCEALGLAEIQDIGPSTKGVPDTIAGRPVRRLGPLPDAEVSRLLLEAAAGFVAYPAPFLAKSTIFAAYCAHGMLPVSAWHRPRRKVEPPPPFWRPVEAVRDSVQEVADRARAWYSPHSIDRCAAAYRELLE